MTIAKEKIYTRLLSETAGVSPRLFQELLLSFGQPSEIFDVTLPELSGHPRVGAKLAKAISRAKESYPQMESEIHDFAVKKIYTVSFLEENYPSLLRALGDPPPLLFYRGTFLFPNEKTVAVIGPNSPSPDAVAQAVRLGRGLAQSGVSVITGPGKGVEASAQVGAVVAEKPTRLVLSCGHEADLTDEEITLGVQVEKKGVLLSEYSPPVKKSPEREAASRRLIVALSQAVLVIASSGADEHTEATFERAIQQGKPIFVFNPGKDADFPAEAVPLAREEEIELLVCSLV
ncbi:MAG TPA: DNA-processing protein DprA [candidate division Zixibacteria bacterium]|nr:DNA-processing protein DprA [candidate division Zixibacteria bacterium]